MSSSNGPPTRTSEIVLDSVTFVLFAVFVAFLFLGYLSLFPAVPFSALGAVALLGSLAVLFAANRLADRGPSEPALASTP